MCFKFCPISFYNVIYIFILDAKRRSYFTMNVKIPATSRNKIPSNDNKNHHNLQQITDRNAATFTSNIILLNWKQILIRLAPILILILILVLMRYPFSSRTIARILVTRYKFMRLNVKHIKHEGDMVVETRCIVN
jgi:hypothetical protein